MVSRSEGNEATPGTDAQRLVGEAGCHSVLIVLLNAGNGTQPDPNEGSETPR